MTLIIYFLSKNVEKDTCMMSSLSRSYDISEISKIVIVRRAYNYDLSLYERHFRLQIELPYSFIGVLLICKDF